MRRLFSAISLLLAGFLSVFPQDARGAEIHLDEKFDSFNLEEGQWNLSATPDASQWEAEEGHLKATFFFKPYQGGEISRMLPEVSRGELSFKVRFPTERGYDHFALQVKLGNLHTAFNHVRQHEWQRHLPEERRWTVLSGKIPKGEWTTFRIRFDNEAGVIEYYRDEETTPVHIETDVAVLPVEGSPGLELVFGNYGLSTGNSGVLVHWLDDITFREGTAPSSQPKATQAKGVMIFSGPGAEWLRAKEIAAILQNAEVQEYPILNRLALTPRNQFYPERMPTRLDDHPPSLIILADAPLDGGLPPFLQEQLKGYVEKGATLLILDGLFGGGAAIQTNPLISLLPADLDPGPLLHWPEGVTLEPGDEATAACLANHEAPRLFYARALKAKEGATVHASAQGRPILLSQRYGEGKVIFWSALPCGESAQTLLKWPGWADLFTPLLPNEN